MKIKTILFTLLCAVCTLPAFAESSVGDFVVVNHVLVEYRGSGGHVVIPDNLGITAIGESVFDGNTSLTSVVIPEGVTEIRTDAFIGCSNLTSVTFPNTLRTIGNRAFYNCGLTSVTIPQSVISIGTYPFRSCDALAGFQVDAGNTVYSAVDGVLYNKNQTTLVAFPGGRSGSFSIPSSVNTIGFAAFHSCSKLTSVTIPNSVSTIEGSAFRYCDALGTINIPASVTTIGFAVFDGCRNLSAINVDAGNTAYSSDAGVLYNKNKTALTAYPAKKGGTSFTIPSTVTVIESFAFAIASLTAITIPSTVSVIESYAFYEASLTAITIPSSVTRIGNNAFHFCMALRDVIVSWAAPLSLSASDVVFLNVSTAAATLHVPAGTKALYQAAEVWKTFGTILEDGAAVSSLAVSPATLNFAAAGGAQSVAVTSNVNWTASDDATWITVSPASGSNNGTISVTAAANTTTSQRTATLTVTGGGVTRTVSITQAAAATPPNNSDFVVVNHVLVEYRGSGGHVVIPDNLGITAIGESVFDSNTSLLSVVIPTGVTEIRTYAFIHCRNLVSVTFPNTLRSIYQEAFFDCGLTSVTIPASVTSMDYPFGACGSLTGFNVNAGNPAYSSADGVLYNKNKTTLVSFPGGKSGTFTVPSSVNTIGQAAFYSCSKLTSVTIPNSVSTIERIAFRYCLGLSTVNIPASVTVIGDMAFDDCTHLSAINVDAGNTAYSSDAGVLYDKNRTSLILYPMKKSGTSFTVPSTVTTIKSYAFIGSTITSIFIPTSVTAINASAFYRATLEDVTVYWATPLSLSAWAFDGVTLSAVTLHVPAGTKALYQAAEVWKTFGTILEDGAAVSSLAVSPATLNFTAAGGAQSVAVTSNVSWTASDNATWITVTPASGSNNGTISVTAAANTATSQRTATVTVSGGGITRTVSITQAAAGTPPNNSDFVVVNHVLVEYRGSGGHVVIPDNLGITIIGEKVFENNTSLTSVVIPEGVTDIETMAFHNCTNLVSVSMPNTLKIIKVAAFQWCFNLVSASIPNSVTTISGFAFFWCQSLISLTIPASVTSIGQQAFNRCLSLPAIQVETGNTAYTSENGVLYNKNKTLLHTYPAGKNNSSFTVPSSVTTLEAGAFLACTSLVSVTIPSQVSSIGAIAFYDCNNLASVTVSWTTPLPLTLSSEGYAIFHNVNTSAATLHVPAGTKALYQAAEVWKTFGTILEDGAAVSSLAVSPATLNFAAAGGTQSVAVTSNVSWTASDNATWITVSPASGSNNGTISVTAAANTTTSQRTATVTVSGGGITRTVSITQAGDVPQPLDTLSVYPYDLSFSASGETKSTAVTASESWSSSVSASWITVTPASGNGNGSITITAAANSTNSVRTGTVTFTLVSGKRTYTVSITQAAAVPSEIVPTGVALNQHDVALETGETVQLSATVSPANATNSAVTWTSSNTQVATVSATGLVTAVAEGTATITVRTQSGNRTDVCTVTVRAKEVVVDPVPPADSQPGYLILRLGLPSDDPFTGTFLVVLPAGLNLDLANTVLLGSVASQYYLSVTPVSAGTWLVEIRRKMLRSATNTTYQEIIKIAYTTDESTPEGQYEVKIRDLEFTFDDHAAIREDEIAVTVTAGGTGNEFVGSSVQVTCYNGILTVTSPAAEQIEIYSMSGSLLYKARKDSGTATFRIGGTVSRGVLIVRGSSGWNRKALLN